MICPRCNGTGKIQMIESVDELIRAMRIPVPKKSWPTHPKRGVFDPGRDLYEGGDVTGKHGCGSYFITYFGGEVSPAAVKEAVSRGLIVQKWDDCPDYWELAK